MSRIRAATGLSTVAGGADAAANAARVALDGLGGKRCDLAAIFASAAFADEAADIAEAVVSTLVPRAMIGVTGGSIVEGAREVEDQPAVAVWAAHLPGAKLRTFAVSYSETADGRAFSGDVPDEEGEDIILFADPYTFPADLFIRWLDEQVTVPRAVVGGMASGGRGPGTHRLWRNDELLDGGAVGVSIGGGVRVRALVSQGCKPIGEPRTVTRSERNVVHEMAGAPPLDHLRDVFLGSSPQERELIQRGLHIGRVVDEYKTNFARGDFLIRNVMGIDNDSGAMAVGDMVEVGQTIQFHVRDAESASEDLRLAAGATPKPGAAMLFTCNGRGSHMFGAPNHDAGVLADAWGVPLAGFSCSGEIGPVGGRTFMHGFTASAALFYDDLVD